MSCFNKRPPTDPPEPYYAVYENDKWQVRKKGQDGTVYWKCRDSVGMGEIHRACLDKQSIIYDNGSDNCVILGEIDWNDPDNVDWYNSIHNPNNLPVQGPSSDQASTEFSYDCRMGEQICEYDETLGRNRCYVERSCVPKPKTIPHTETLPVPVAVPHIEPVPCYFPASAQQEALKITENLKKRNPKNAPKVIPPPVPVIPDVTYDETKDKKKRKKKVSLAVEPVSLPVVPEEQKHSFTEPESTIPPENITTTTEDMTYDTIYKIGMFVAIAGIVYLLFNPSKNTNPGKDLGENATFQAFSEL